MHPPSSPLGSLDLLLIEDDLDLALSVSAVLKQQGHHIELAQTLQEAQTALQDHSFEVALLDLRLPDGSGLDLIERLRAAGSAVLMWTAYNDAAAISRALRFGAAGYVLKDTSPAELNLALHTAVAGGRFLSDRACRMLVNPTESSPRLTHREQEVMVALSRGLTYAETANALSISLGTVQSYVKNLYAKLEVNSKAELAALATRLGWIDGCA